MSTMQNTSELKAHRVPPSTNKRLGSARKEVPHGKRHKQVSKGENKSQCPESSRPPASPMDCEPQFQKLDAKDPVHTKRIVQRRKTLSKGKNTAGYECYIEQVPTEKRRLRSMETPMTPDPTLNIPSKRWQGLVKAWRVALHKYDPADLVNSSIAEVSVPSKNEEDQPPGENDKSNTLQARQLEEAAAKGLLVDLAPEESEEYDADSPVSVLTEQTSRTPVRREINFDEDTTGGLEHDEDSDDDLL